MEEWGSGSEESDEEDERERLGEGVNASKVDGDGSSEEKEEEGPEKMHDEVEDSDSESYSSEQDSPETIGKILSSDRSASPQKFSGVAKAEATKRPRKVTGEEEIAPVKRKKDAGAKNLASSDGSRNLKFKDRMDSSENDENAGKKSRKQNLQTEASSQLVAPITPRNGELEVKGKHSQKMDMVAEKMQGQDLSRKQKKKPAVWTPNDENVVAVGAMRRIRAGLDFPPKKVDDYWIKLSEELQGKWTRSQIYEKLRRMKSRYQVIADRMKVENSNTFQFKNVHEENLFNIWRRTWGQGGKAEKEKAEELKTSKEEENDMKMYEGQKQANRTAKSRGKLEAFVSQTKDVNDRLGTPRGKDDEHVRQDAEKTEYKAQGAGAVQMETLLQRCSMNTTVNELLKQIQDAHKAFTEDLQASCKRVLQEVDAKAMLIVQSALKKAGNNSAFRNTFSIPSLAAADCLNITIPCMNGSGDNKLRKQWHEQRIQELKVFSQRLHLIQEECRIQQEHFDMQLNSDKL